MNSGAGPTKERIAPDPTKSPVPMAPPKAKNLDLLAARTSNTGIKARLLNMPTFQSTRQLIRFHDIEVTSSGVRRGDSGILMASVIVVPVIVAGIRKTVLFLERHLRHRYSSALYRRQNITQHNNPSKKHQPKGEK